MDKNKRRQVRVVEYVMTSSYSVKSIDELINTLKTLRSQGFTEVEMEAEIGYYDNIDQNLTAVKTRLETEREYNKRIEEEKERDMIRERRERQEYEKYKKKYG
jgi:hypothetical protein